MAIIASDLTSSFATNNAASYTTASVTPTANVLVLAIITAGSASGSNVVPSSVSGAGLTFTLIGSHAQGTTRRTTYWRAMTGSPATEAITIDFGVTGQANCTWSFIELAGVDTSGVNGAGALVQDDYATDGGTAATSGTVTLTNAISDANNMIVGMFARSGTAGITEDADFTQISAATSSESGAVNTHSAFSQTSATATFTSAVWGAGLIEVQVAAAVASRYAHRQILAGVG